MTYEIKPIDNNEFAAIVYSTSYENPLQNLEEISKELLRTYNCPCNVLFDFLLTNGDEFNRFATGRFDGERIKYNSLKIVEIDDEYQRNQINSYYSGKLSILKNSVLSRYQIAKFAANA